MTMSGATVISVLIVCIIPVLVGFVAAELDEYHALKQGNHK